jgi:UDP-N-acetylglucosamine:LPS N-acetylglucosamine transferase
MNTLPKTILLLPLFTMPSGHQHAAEAIRKHISLINSDLQVVSVDLLSRTFGHWESQIANFYMRWLDWAPNVYQFIYRMAVQRKRPSSTLYQCYEYLFMRTLEQVIEETNPDLIFCTHSLPAYLCAIYKKTKRHPMPAVVNVYTDYHLHQLWPSDPVDRHFVPDGAFACYLHERGVSASQIDVTGIPLDPGLYGLVNMQKQPSHTTTILITGGHAGNDAMDHVIQELQTQWSDASWQALVMCGTNQRLRQSIEQAHDERIQAIGYIADKQLLRQIYSRADIVLSKAGGLTLSECLRLQKPTFIYHSLPGQEHKNMCHLSEQALVRIIDKKRGRLNLESLQSLFAQPVQLVNWRQQIASYNRQFYDEYEQPQIITAIQRLLGKI